MLVGTRVGQIKVYYEHLPTENKKVVSFNDQVKAIGDSEYVPMVPLKVNDSLNPVTQEHIYDNIPARKPKN